MGTVRREGDWRLEKRRDGVYEITFRKEPQLKVTTPESTGGDFNWVFDTLPVRHVDSYNEAEGLFEEHAQGFPPMGFDIGSDMAATVPTLPKGDVDFSVLPPGGFGAALFFAGFLLVATFWGSFGQVPFQAGVVSTVGGAVILGYGGYLVGTQGWRDAQDYFITTDDSRSNSSTGDSESETTPPAPTDLRNELFFERANRRCEYCNDEIDQPEVHHITPRSEGGPNDPRNLIVLCPNCHRKADRGAISRSTLRYRVKTQTD